MRIQISPEEIENYMRDLFTPDGEWYPISWLNTIRILAEQKGIDLSQKYGMWTDDNNRCIVIEQPFKPDCWN